MNARVWYVSYGSNMSSDRLARYLQGGQAPGGRVEHAGARDTELPRRSIPVTLPGRVYFAGESRVWGGGRAYYDPNADGPALARAYLVTREQFEDIHTQEPPVYDRLLELGTHDGVPMLTFTSSLTVDSVARTKPAEAYLRTMAEGIVECHRLTAERARAYLDGLLAQP